MPSGWSESDDGLHRRFEFPSFTEAWAFMARVAEIAERMDHHPDWSNSYGVVEISLRSHDAGGRVTSRDRRLAAEIDALLGEPVD